MTTPGLITWLSSFDDDALASLGRRRPEIRLGAAPGGLLELAQRLIQPNVIVMSLRTRAQPFLEVVEAMQALGGTCTRGDLSGFLADAGPRHEALLGTIVDQLCADALMWPTDDGQLQLPEVMAQIYPNPLELGAPARVLLADAGAEGLRRCLRALGLPAQKNRAEMARALGQFFEVRANVEEAVDGVPEELRDSLLTLVTASPFDDVDGMDLDWADESRYERAEYTRGLVPDPYDVDAFRGGGPLRAELSLRRRRQLASDWLRDRGLLIPGPYSYDYRLPAEVARVIVGPQLRAPFSPERPPVITHEMDRERITAESSVAARAFADHVLAVLDHIAREPVPTVKSGGIGTRELTRLAKATGSDELTTRFALELADACELLHQASGRVRVSAAFGDWRDAGPATRYSGLLTAWWAMGRAPTEATDADGKALRVLARATNCEGCRLARVVLLDVMAEVAAPAERHSVALAALWQLPLVHVIAQDAEDPLATVWREAALLGVIALDALTELGTALVREDRVALLAESARLLPEAADGARFGADLTVYVTGAPTARISRLLDAAADREGRGGAITWRFSPASVRRALDEGMTADDLRDGLTAISIGELPQPLLYLLADVSRRHGNLQVSAVVTCIRSDDEALLREVAVDRKLARLGLRLLAPTVLSVQAPAADVLKLLRSAGYLPMPEGDVSDDREDSEVDAPMLRRRRR